MSDYSKAVSKSETSETPSIKANTAHQGRPRAPTGSYSCGISFFMIYLLLRRQSYRVKESQRKKDFVSDSSLLTQPY